MANLKGRRGQNPLPTSPQEFSTSQRQAGQNTVVGSASDSAFDMTADSSEKPLPLPPTVQDSPSTAVRIVIPSIQTHEPSSAQFEATIGYSPSQRPLPNRKDSANSKFSVRWVSDEQGEAGPEAAESSPRQNNSSLQVLPIRTAHSRAVSAPVRRADDSAEASDQNNTEAVGGEDGEEEETPQLQYFHRPVRKPVPRASLGNATTSQSSATSTPVEDPASQLRPYALPLRDSSRPSSSSNLSPELLARGRALSPRRRSGSMTNERSVSTGRLSDHRSASSVDLLNVSYSQQAAQTLALDNSQLKAMVGGSASLLDTRKTFEMYRANVKKTNDQSIQYEFAVLMVNAAREGMPNPDGTHSPRPDTEDLLREARNILQRLSDKGYPYAQYYLGDGYFSGLFSRNRPDYEKAWQLFVAASKHGHAEGGYRAALCYEFGWGCRRDFGKAVQYYRQSASKGHPGAATRLGKACLIGDMGLVGKGREGVKWLKRAAEAADQQHNSAPFELGLLHLTGYEPDVFKDESYAAQLFTQSAELGHAEASMRMGDAYEHGLLTCPRDPALSLHFYNGAAVGGMPEAMMALCAWYMVGAEPVLVKNEYEAYEWAKQAADLEYAKAEYAIGYFTEMGIGCRRDPLEANVWYVRAAEQGDERAKQRLEIIRAASAGETALPSMDVKKKALKKKPVPTSSTNQDEKGDKGWLKRRGV